MEILKESKLLDNDINNLIQQLENEIVEKITNLEKVDEELQTSDIQKIKNETKKEVQCYFDLILEKILNYYLDKIKCLNIKEYFEITKGCYFNDEWEKIPEDYKKASQLIDDIMECCDPCGKYGNVYEDAEYIAYHIIRKVVGVNNSAIILPLKIEYIKNYSISTNTLSNELDSEIWYIILYIATHYYVLSKIK